MIVDWEGMATEFLARLHAEGRRVVTILQTNQYRDLSSFSDAGTFVPLSTDAHGHVFREVAPARITLPREDHPDNPLCLQVALIRDLRRTVPVRPDPEEAEVPARWDSDLPPDERTWWREGWQATAAPAQETIAKLIPIVTAQETPTINAIELAQTSIHRWPAQEKVIKDYLLPLGLDTNHGCARIAVENSEVAKRRARLEQRLTRLKQWAQSAGKREAQASRRRERLRIAHNQRSMEEDLLLWISPYHRTKRKGYSSRRLPVFLSKTIPTPTGFPYHIPRIAVRVHTLITNPCPEYPDADTTDCMPGLYGHYPPLNG